ncbi:hypothetical protein N7492_000206 [Penicillium capsulatum]|uniref:Uncharacterized protein n=1 Tax=Penicillium capsulatum TaxID=69766 RepID=A0A9W9LYS8_9EURO|nr:hypothetical protein N7492_000206 [Penicillium capsulatum]
MQVRPIFLLMFVASISASTTLEYFANEGCTGSPAKYGYEISGLCYELRPYRSVRVNPGDGERLYFFDDAAGCFSHLDNTITAPFHLTTSSPYVLTRTHQTIHERNFTRPAGCGIHTIWLRTCYDEHLVEKYEDMRQWAEVEGDGFLVEAARYAFDDGRHSPDGILG